MIHSPGRNLEVQEAICEAYAELEGPGPDLKPWGVIWQPGVSEFVFLPHPHHLRPHTQRLTTVHGDKPGRAGNPSISIEIYGFPKLSMDGH